MQFKTKLGLVDIPNEDVLAASRDIIGSAVATLEPAGPLGSLSTGDLFGGEGSDQQNALHDALILAAADYALTIPEDAKRGTDTKSAIYQFVEETPATSLVVELVRALNTLGWKIAPPKASSPNLLLGRSADHEKK